MKKTLSAILCLLLCLSFCACTDKEKAQIERGEFADGVYTNSFADIEFTAPEGWSFADNEELLMNTEHAGKLLDTERLIEIFEETGIAFDMQCYSEDYTHSVGLLFINNKHDEFKDFGSAEEILRELIKQTTLDTSAGISEDTVTFGKETYLRLCATTKTNTGETGYATFYGREKGDATIVIVTACTDSFTVADSESYFAK